MSIYFRSGRGALVKLLGLALVALGFGAAVVSWGHPALDFASAQVCAPVPSGLVSWWRAEGNALDSAGGNNGTLQAGATFDTGLVGQAFSFDGIDDYVLVPDDPSLNVTDGLTIAAWINLTSHDGPRVILSKWNDNTGEWSYIFKGSSSAEKRIELSESVHNDLVNLFGTTSVPLNTWVHAAATYDTNVARLYLDGTEDASQTVGPDRFIDSSITDVLIGAVFTGGGVSENFAGRIDEVQIYDRALAASEVQAIFDAGSAGKCEATAMATPTPPPLTPTPTRPPGVGGISVDPVDGALPLEAARSSGGRTGVLLPLAAGSTALALAGAAWVVRRRRVR